MLHVAKTPHKHNKTKGNLGKNTRNMYDKELDP